jgi:hypothetical protein
MPFMLPCRHNACIDCIRQSIDIDNINFDCPIDNCFIVKVSEAKENRDLFTKVSLKE